ncbi:cyclin [Xylariales sp. AK1849]|nr:cyclin [Xylariales sp. AK1849]
MSSAVSTVVHPTLYPHLPSPAYSTRYQQPQRHIPPPLSLKKVQENSLADEAALLSGGLRTPPAEGIMSTAYHQNHNPVLSSTYDSHVALARQPGALNQASRAGTVLCDVAMNQMSRSQPQQQVQGQQFQHQSQSQYQPQQHHVSTSNLALVNPHPCSATSRHSSTRPSTPSSTGTSFARSEGTMSRRDSTMVIHSLQLPSCISSNGGNLDDFAALMTCFFWFENMETIQAAEDITDRRSTTPIPPLSSFTRPCAAYKKWVNSILSTTQVTQNVILLALLFVYRLKSSNPKVNGSPGSEYRLLTVALMLGNKFLDDNTYTNKTWAEVSGIAVKEIHVMEVEFLSNMRYGLLTSKDQWADWLRKLACFHEYCEKAELTERAAEMTARRQRATSALPSNMSSPIHRGFSSPLPSPTSILPSSMQTTASSLTAYSPNTALYNPNQNWHAPYQPAPALSPLAAKPNLGFHGSSRKRSLEGSEMTESAPKRSTRQTSVALPPAVRHTPASHDSVRLPIPQLTLDTSQAGTPQVSYPSLSNYSQAPVSLPPLGPGMRAMATVYPHTTTWTPQGPVLATCGPQTPSSYTAPSNFGTPTKRHSPGSLAVYASSPLEGPFASHTPISNSPSVYLQQRNSPYKPVRPVNTLNYPPPSIPLSEYHLGSAQMHYQPLGRRNVRSGIVPEFIPNYDGGRPTPVSQAPGQHYRAR